MARRPSGPHGSSSQQRIAAVLRSLMSAYGFPDTLGRTQSMLLASWPEPRIRLVGCPPTSPFVYSLPATLLRPAGGPAAATALLLATVIAVVIALAPPVTVALPVLVIVFVVVVSVAL